MRKKAILSVLVLTVLILAVNVNGQNQFGSWDYIGKYNSEKTYASTIKVVGTPKAVNNAFNLQLNAEYLQSILKELNSAKVIIDKFYTDEKLGSIDELKAGFRACFNSSLSTMVSLDFGNGVKFPGLDARLSRDTKYLMVRNIRLNGINVDGYSMKGKTIMKKKTYGPKRDIGMLLLKWDGNSWQTLMFAPEWCMNFSVLSYGIIRVTKPQIVRLPGAPGTHTTDTVFIDKKKPVKVVVDTGLISIEEGECFYWKIDTNFYRKPYDTLYRCDADGNTIFRVRYARYVNNIRKYRVRISCNKCDTCEVVKEVVKEDDDCPTCPKWEEPKLCLTSIDFGGHIALAPFKENVMEEIYHAPVLPTGTDYGFYVVISEANDVYNITAEWGTTSTLIDQPAGVSAIKVWYGTSATGSPDDIVNELSSIAQHNASKITLIFVFEDGNESKAYSFEAGGSDYTLSEDEVTTFSGGEDEYYETVNIEKSILPIFVEAGATFNLQSYPITFGVGWYHILNNGTDLHAGSIYGSIGLMSKKGLGLSFKAYAPSKWTIGMNNSETPKLGFVTDKWSFGVEGRIRWIGLQITKFNGGLYVVGDNIPEDKQLLKGDLSRWTIGVIFHIGGGHRK